MLLPNLNDPKAHLTNPINEAIVAEKIQPTRKEALKNPCIDGKNKTEYQNS